MRVVVPGEVDPDGPDGPEGADMPTVVSPPLSPPPVFSTWRRGGSAKTSATTVVTEEGAWLSTHDTACIVVVRSIGIAATYFFA